MQSVDKNTIRKITAIATTLGNVASIAVNVITTRGKELGSSDIWSDEPLFFKRHNQCLRSNAHQA